MSVKSDEGPDMAQWRLRGPSALATSPVAGCVEFLLPERPFLSLT